MELSSNKGVCNPGLNSTASRSPSPITMSMSSVSSTRSAFSSSTPPTILETTKCDKRSGPASFWKFCRRYWIWTCFNLRKSKPKIEEKSARGQRTELGHDSCYTSMSSVELDENLKALIAYCKRSYDLRDSDENFLRR